MPRRWDHCSETEASVIQKGRTQAIKKYAAGPLITNLEATYQICVSLGSLLGSAEEFTG